MSKATKFSGDFSKSDDAALSNLTCNANEASDDEEPNEALLDYEVSNSTPKSQMPENYHFEPYIRCRQKSTPSSGGGEEFWKNPKTMKKCENMSEDDIQVRNPFHILELVKIPRILYKF